MSYDVYFKGAKCEKCGHDPERDMNLPGPTYNLTPIFDRALTNEDLPDPNLSEFAVVILKNKTQRPRGLRLLSGRTGADTLKQLENALVQLEDPAREAEFRALEPPNKWGTLESAIECVRKYRDAAREYPENVWDVR